MLTETDEAQLGWCLAAALKVTVKVPTVLPAIRLDTVSLAFSFLYLASSFLPAPFSETRAVVLCPAPIVTVALPSTTTFLRAAIASTLPPLIVSTAVSVRVSRQLWVPEHSKVASSVVPLLLRIRSVGVGEEPLDRSRGTRRRAAGPLGRDTAAALAAHTTSTAATPPPPPPLCAACTTPVALDTADVLLPPVLLAVSLTRIVWPTSPALGV